MQACDWDLIRGGHYGQRSCEPHQKAEHMAAPTNPAYVKNALANPEPSTHDPKRTFEAVRSQLRLTMPEKRSSPCHKRRSARLSRQFRKPCRPTRCRVGISGKCTRQAPERSRTADRYRRRSCGGARERSLGVRRRRTDKPIAPFQFACPALHATAGIPFNQAQTP